MDISIAFSFIFSIIILVDGILYLRKNGSGKQRVSGILSVITGVMFIVASVMGVTGASNTSDTLLLVQWMLYIVGFIIFIVAMVIRKKNQ